MSKKKGLSLDEKRSRMTDFFYEKKDFFQLKDLEKQCPKEKGITSMSVKEVVQSLVDDGIVDSEKIGTSIYFWAFLAKLARIKRKMDDLEAQLKELGNKKQQLLEASKKAKLGKEKSDEREEVLEELNKRRLEREEILKELEKYKDSDPEVLKQINEESNTAKDAANRWTDNIFSTKAWIKNKFCLDDSVVDNTFGISSDLDYLE